MSKIRIENDQLVITMQGARKFFTLKSEVTINIDSVTGVSVGLSWKDLPKAFDKILGTNSNMFYYGGKFKLDGDKVFYDLKKSEDAVVIELKDEEFKQLIIGVDNPAATVDLIQKALNSRH